MGRHRSAPPLPRPHAARRTGALARKNDEALALIRRGNELLTLGRPEEALAAYERVLELKPDDVGALQNRGAALRSLKRYDEALRSYRHALEIDPRCTATLHNLGNLLRELKRYQPALATYAQALALDPRHAGTLENRGLLLQKMGRYDEAAQAFADVLGINPEHDYALGSLFHAQQYCCDWHAYGETLERLVREVSAGKRAARPFAFLTASDCAPAQLQCARTYYAHKCRVEHAPLWNGARYRHDRIRVAYVSADLRDHATSYLLAGVFARHDRTRFETVAISLRPPEDSAAGRRVHASFDRFVDVSRKSDREVAELMRALEIDIAVDLKGYTQNHRAAIFGYRPAPIHASYLGYPGTTGSPFIDYIIADETIIPAAHAPFYSEEVAWLPESYQPRDTSLRASGLAVTRARAGLPDAAFVFCCFNGVYKITPAIFDAWMRLIAAVPGSVLWLLKGNETANANVRRETQSRGVAPERIVFADRAPLEHHLARLPLADLFLDTLPCNAHTTASDALWAGLPVLTCMGNAFAARVAGSLLKAIGLPELITDNLTDYEARALKLATDPALLREIRNKLASNRATYPLFDTDRLCRHLESAYVTMWERAQRGEPPRGFAVKPVVPPRYAAGTI